jgi:phosphohistidine phosphatase
MRVVLFRHGIAGTRDARRWPNDALRPLTARGRERTEAAARGLKRLFPLTRILSSPLLRATQTAEILREAYGMTREIEVLPALAPMGSHRDILVRLGGLRPGESVALVGHEPDLGKFAGVMVFGAPNGNLQLKKAGACIVDFVGHPESGAGKVLALLPPRLLRRRTSSGAKS